MVNETPVADPRIRMVLMDDGRVMPVYHRTPNPRAHACSARIIGHCAGCGRDLNLCRATKREIARMNKGRWRDAECSRGSRA